VEEQEVPRRRKQISAPLDEKAIGKRLRDLRLRQGMTQAEVAEELAINQPLVSQYEKGVLRLHGTLVAAFARALSVTPDEIFGIKASKENGHAKDRRFLHRLRQIDALPKRDRQALLRTIDTFLKGSRTS
jgi:transcriptional regulator with XRE-family HTH domain